MLNVKPLTSRHNPIVQQTRALLRSAAERRESALFAAEGVKLAAELASRGWQPEYVLSTQQNSETISELFADSDVTFYVLGDELLAYVTGESAPQGVICVCKIHWPPSFSAQGNALVLCGIQDPGNMGTILRTAAAFGIRDIFTDSGCADIYSPKTLRASMGAVFALSVRECGDDAGKAIDSLRGSGYSVLAAALRAEKIMTPPEAFEAFRGRRALVLGSEGRGLPDEIIASCDAAVCIPMDGMESLNVAVAAGILMWEILSRT